MKVKEAIRILMQEDPEADLVVKEMNMETVGHVTGISSQSNVTDEMSGDEYGDCVVVTID